MGVAQRLRDLLGRPDSPYVAETAARLGVEEVSLRMSIDEDSPHPTVEVLAAVIREYGLDPTWLLTGVYDAATHRSAMENPSGAPTAMRDLLEKRSPISDPTAEPLRH